MAGRDIRRTGIYKLTIYFIGEKEQIVLLYKVTNLIHFTTGIQITGRIVGVTNKNRFGTLINQFFKFLYFRKGKALFNVVAMVRIFAPAEIANAI